MQPALICVACWDSIRSGRTPSMPRRWACRGAGSRNGRSACRRQSRRTSRCCPVARERACIRRSASARWWSTASSRCAMSHQRACGARLGPKHCCTICRAMSRFKGSASRGCRRTIYRILQQAGRIAHRLPQVQEPQERPAAMRYWQLDFKDASTVAPEVDGKRQHVVEVLNVIDEGTSVLVDAQVSTNFHAETTLEAIAELFVRQGLPQVLRMDRDVRFVGSPSGSDFPSALVRFCECLGVGVLLCDPHHPEQNGFVERYHRTYQQECLAVDRPGSVEQVREVTAAFAQHYNWSRPHQGLSCGNRPPRVAFPTLPELPAVPDLVDPDRWLQVRDGLHLVRKVRRDGSVRVDLKSYYVGRALAGQHVALHLSAAKRALLVVQEHQVLKTLPLKGLTGQALRFEAFVQLMMGQARSERQLRTAQERRVRLGGSDSP